MHCREAGRLFGCVLGMLLERAGEPAYVWSTSREYLPLTVAEFPRA